MGSRVGAEKSAAKKVGCSVEEWRDRRAANLLHCRVCRRWKHAFIEFAVDPSRSVGRASTCKPCFAAISRARIYGLKPKDVEQMFKDQDGRCLICERRGARMEIDHNHKTGKVRGLLCSRCNGALGQFLDDKGLLLKAVRYLGDNDG